MLCRIIAHAAEGGVEGTTICDAGCGTGSLSIPLALRVRLLPPPSPPPPLSMQQHCPAS
jgi:magnesium-protoporphyrin O-methyltransferase